MRKISKPAEGEFAPYTIMYIGLLPDDGLVLRHLRSSLRATRELLLSLPDGILRYRYAPSKWTIKEILGHIIDDERIYTYRALRFARNDPTELPGFEENLYASTSGANDRSVRELLAELGHVRRSTIAFFASLPDEVLFRAGIADGKIMSVRAAAYHIAGHELHHLGVIRNRYLSASRFAN
jgi:uncharacterized damage-inducible protein DinB